jgi:hypothetical protein
MKLLITKSWGFIVTYAVEAAGGKTSNWLFVHNVNGMFVRAVQVEFGIDVWHTWASAKGFDYVMAATDARKLLTFEAFYLNVSEPFHKCSMGVKAITYRLDGAVAHAVLTDGRIVCIPLVIE